MDLKGLEKYLALNRIDYKEATDNDGLLINLGFLVGRVHVKYDEESKTFNFNDKSRWIIQVVLMALMLFFLISNFNVYTQVQLYTCVGVTIAMFGIFGYKETRIKQLKQAIAEEHQSA
ncbi:MULTISPECIES: hypothetical protein [Enterovibrio]|uniref:Uncharacterized protein n=1 Tax=Enterovibrio norvegicus FF-454 TaxID=1185651 RepID=A0A1E5C7Y0_9GAMM|nr:hypothetical protein [Enterovibrio norvegicus]OEE61579.1 hypothetical protein A1OK_09480 [Enterovibrio norvegicus FF-454]OEE75718.1 hypothetical protein A1OQ_06760 [Enterovibrio norvegicus FF-162]